MTAYRLILASSSPRRRELLASLGVTFDIRKPDIDETCHPGETPFAYVERVGIDKAQAIAQQIQNENVLILAADTIVLAADTIGVTPQGALLGKPTDAADARAMLRLLRGRMHLVSTLIVFCVVSADNRAPRIHTRRSVTRVTMRAYTDAEIDAYIATGDPMDKAGSYAIQHPTFRPVARIDGCYTNVVGLPLCEVKRGLAVFGLLDSAPEGCDCAAYTSYGDA